MPINHNNCITLPNSKKNTCVNCRKKVHSLLKGLSCEELALLEKNKYEVLYKAGEIVCKAGTKPSGLLCLNEGKVKITKLGVNGVEQIVALRKPVDFIGFRTLMGESNFLTSAIALEASVICVIDKKVFFDIIRSNNRLSFRIIRFLAKELNNLENRMVNLTQKHIRARLADALLIAHDVYGQSPDDGILNVALKRADLAALANMTTANAIRVLSAFAKENLIEINRRKIKINNLRALTQISLFGR